MSTKRLLALSIFSALFYGLLSLGMYHWFYEEGIASAFSSAYPLAVQLITGAACGLMAAVVIRFAAVREPVAGVLDDFYIVRVIREMRLSPFDCAQLSLFAGAGEEMLFRGTLQPLLGIWITSILFIGIHGYFKFNSAGHWLFGGLMFGLSMLLGVLFESTGLVSAMAAHAAYDVVMLWQFSGKDSDTGALEEP